MFGSSVHYKCTDKHAPADIWRPPPCQEANYGNMFHLASLQPGGGDGCMLYVVLLSVCTRQLYTVTVTFQQRDPLVSKSQLASQIDLLLAISSQPSKSTTDQCGTSTVYTHSRCDNISNQLSQCTAHVTRPTNCHNAQHM